MSVSLGHFEQVLELLDLFIDRGCLSFDLTSDQAAAFLHTITIHQGLHVLLSLALSSLLRSHELVSLIFRRTVDILNRLHRAFPRLTTLANIARRCAAVETLATAAHATCFCLTINTGVGVYSGSISY